MKRRLERIEIPGEHDARVRTWQTVRAAFETRERVSWPRRHGRSLALAAAGCAIVAAAVTPPGESVVNAVRDAVGRERVVGVRPAHQALITLPAPGRLLVDSANGIWTVQRNGSRRRLGPYDMASWSPRGLFVAAVSGGTLFALDPVGNVRWSKPRKQRVAHPRWSYEGFRIAYLADRSLRVITGDGKQDWALGSADHDVAPAWRPRTHQVAFVGTDRRIRLVDADTRRTLWRAGRTPDFTRELAWTSDGLLVALAETTIRVYSAAGRKLAEQAWMGETGGLAVAPRGHRFAFVLRTPVASNVLVTSVETLPRTRRVFGGAGRIGALTWSPDGRWLAAAWPGADQLVFVRVRGTPGLYAVSNVARQFDPAAPTARFPQLGGWCCAG